MGDEIAVLVVDEDTDMLELTETFLEREGDGIRVTTENRPTDAAERATDGEFDCVVSDLRMPGIGGLELCERIHERDPDLPCFLFTAAETDDVDERAGEIDLAGVIRKGAGTDHYTDLADQIEATVGE